MMEEAKLLHGDEPRMEVPSPDSVRHWVRELDPIKEGFEVIRMTRRKGNLRERVWSLPALARAMARTTRDLDTPLDATEFLNAGFNWVNSAELVSWVRTVIGDVELADALESRIAGVSSEFDKMRTIENVLDYRFRQYTDALEAAGEEISVYDEQASM